MILTKFLSGKRLSQQLKKPSGWLGKYIITKRLNTSSSQLNLFCFELLNLQKKDKILEIGFGTGQLIKKMSTKLDGGTIDGIDFSEVMHKEASKVNKLLIDKKCITLHLLECKELPFKKESFSKVCSVNTLYFWEHPEKYFREILRVMQKDALFVLGFRDKVQMKLLNADTEVFNLYTNEEIISLLKKSGFQHVTLKKKNDSPLISFCIHAIK